MPPSGMTNYTYAFGDSGFLLNTDNANTVPFFDVTDIAGLDSAPQRTNTDEHQGQDGTYVDSQYMSERTIVITGDMYTDINDPETILMLLRQQFSGSQGVKPFYFALPGQTLKYINCLGGGIKYDQDTNRSIGKTAGVQLTLFAGDPYVYDYPAQVAGIALPVLASNGMHFNVAFNLGFGGQIAGNQATLTNNGTHTAYPIITLTGPLVNPVLVDSVSGNAMAFSISLQGSDQLAINCQNRSVVLNGTVSRRNTLAGMNWFSVPAGATESISFSADSGTGSMAFQLSNTYF
jgi:Phage tail protein